MPDRQKILYSNHAVKQMFQRDISPKEIELALQKGEIIKEYPTDKPYPSKILLDYSNNRPIHIVYSYNLTEGTYIIITAYIPNTELWENDFKTRKKQ